MAKKSAGFLVYRYSVRELEVLLVHPGGPFWATKDDGSWSIPKGEFKEGEDALTAATREFIEETGWEVGAPLLELEPITQPSGKIVYAWAFSGTFDPAHLVSNTITIEFPPRSGEKIEIPEVDRAEWFTVEEARSKLFEGQFGLVEQLQSLLAS